MKTVKHFGFSVVFLVLPFFSFSQDRTAEPATQNVKTTFSVEINSKTTPEELTRIEKMFKEDYNMSLSFGDVKIIHKNIVSFKMKLQNGKQSITKSVQNTNVPIDTFSIHLEDRGFRKYHVTIEHHKENGITSIMQYRNSGIFDSFADEMLNTDFSDLNREMEVMLKDMEAAQQKFLQLFNNLQNTPDIQKDQQTGNEEITVAVTPETNQ